MLTILRAQVTGAMLLALGACGGEGDGGSGPGTPNRSLRVIQAAESTATLDVLVDGAVVVNGPAAGTASSTIALDTGQRTVSFRRTGAPRARTPCTWPWPPTRAIPPS